MQCRSLLGGFYKKGISLNVGDDSRKKKNDREHCKISRKNHHTQPIRLRVFDQSDCKLSTNQKCFPCLSPYNNIEDIKNLPTAQLMAYTVGWSVFIPL